MITIKQQQLFKTEEPDIAAGVSNKFKNYDASLYDNNNMNLLTQILNSRNRKQELKKSREFVWSTGLLYRLIKLKVDFICSGFEPIHEDEKIEKYYKDLYKDLKVDNFIKNLSFENEVIGEAYTFYNWDGDEPNNIALLNPELVKTKSALGEDFIYLKPSDSIRNLLNSNNPEEVKRVRKLIPDKVIPKWEKGKAVLLDKETSQRYFGLKAYHEQYAHSPLEPIKKDLMLLHELIDADYSVAKKIKNLITHAKIGDKDVNDGITPQSVIEDVEKLFDQPNSNTLELFTQWFVDVEYPLPPIEEIFASEKYKDVRERILDWSGVGIFFSSDSSSYASGHLKVKPAKQEVENGRDLIKEALDDFNLMVAKKKGFTTYNGYKTPKIKFNKNALTNDKFILETVKFLFTYGLLSEEEVVEEFGYDFVRQMKKKKDNAEYGDDIELHFEPSQGLSENDDDSDSEKSDPEKDSGNGTPRR